jgi:hypothetical protein
MEACLNFAVLEKIKALRISGCFVSHPYAKKRRMEIRNSSTAGCSCAREWFIDKALVSRKTY